MADTGSYHHLDKLVDRYSLHLIYIFFALLVLVKIVLSLNFFSPVALPDEAAYDNFAHNIVYGKLYGMMGNSYPPGYPLLLSLAYHISNDKHVIYHIMLIISAFVSSMIIFPSYFILEKYCSKVVSALGAITVSVLPMLSFYSFTIMTEALFIPLFIFSIWFIHKSYETDDKKWALLASLSTVYLYMTRSTGLAMLIAFVLTFIVYIILNFKHDRLLVLIRKKSFLMATFIIFLSAWLIYSTYFVDISQPFSDKYAHNYNFGSSYNIEGTSAHGLDVFANLANMITAIKLSTNLIAYLFAGSFFLLLFVLYYFILLVTDKKAIKIKNHPLVIPFLYASVSSLLLIFITISFLFENDFKDLILGRYVDPIIPFIIIVGIICISNVDWRISDKKARYFLAIGVLLILVLPCIFSWGNIVINVFNDLQDNPSLYVYSIFYGYPASQAFMFYSPDYTVLMQNVTTTLPVQNVSSYVLPALFMSACFMAIIALISISLKKQDIKLLLAFILISSLVFSAVVYSVSVTKSNDGSDNGVTGFLASNTNDSTIYLIDQSNTKSNINAEKYVYGFWNNGDFGFINSRNISEKAIGLNKTIYLISEKALPYDRVANDSNLILYKIK